MKARFPNFTLELDLEGGWNVSTIILSGPEPKAGTLEGQSTGKHQFQPNIVIATEKVGPGETSESYTEKQRRGLKKVGVSRSEVALPVQVVLDNGTKGLICEQVLVGPNGEHVRQLQLVTIKNGVAYTFIASTLEGKKKDPSVEAILWSFDVTDAT